MLVADDDGDARARIREELKSRYAGGYRVICEGSALAALDGLERLHAAGEPVALVLAGPVDADLTGEGLPSRAGKVLPPGGEARAAGGLRRLGRAEETADAMLRSMALGRMDYYVLEPWRRPDEFYSPRTVTEFLHEWDRTQLPRAPRAGARVRAGRAALVRAA